MTFSIPLDGLRTLSEQFLPDSCSISRSTRAVTEDGTSDTWATIATVSCRVSPLASGTNEALGGAEQISAIAQWTVWLPAGTDISVKDRIVYGSRTFEVARVGARSYEVIREVLCREVT